MHKSTLHYGTNCITTTPQLCYDLVQILANKMHEQFFMTDSWNSHGKHDNANKTVWNCSCKCFAIPFIQWTAGKSHKPHNCPRDDNTIQTKQIFSLYNRSTWLSQYHICQSNQTHSLYNHNGFCHHWSRHYIINHNHCKQQVKIRPIYT